MAYYKINADGSVASASRSYGEEWVYFEVGNEPQELLDALAVEEQKALVARAEKIVEDHIQEPIDAYNLAHGVKFENVHNCANYKDALGYPHHIFCGDIWLFNMQVWMFARDLQTDIDNRTVAQPTEEEFKAMLPIYAGTV